MTWVFIAKSDESSCARLTFIFFLLSLNISSPKFLNSSRADIKLTETVIAEEEMNFQTYDFVDSHN